MERTLLKKLYNNYVLVFIALLTFGFMGAQTISTPTVTENPLEATFTLTNGGGQNKFLTTTQYNFILTPGNISFGNFSIGNPPPEGNGNSAIYTTQINAPLGTQGGLYTVKVNSTNPNFTSGESNTFTLINAFEIDDQSYTGYIHCQTPGVSYRLVTITNTGNIIDKYNLSVNPNVGGTEEDLGLSVRSMDGNVLTETPILVPDESFTFMLRFEALPGTEPNKNNYADLLINSSNDNSVDLIQSLHTWTFCGNGNNIPGGEDSPDLRVTKTSPPATVGDEFIYTITLSNREVENALTPTILDTIPTNLTVVEYYLGEVENQPDTRNIYLSYDEPTRLFQASYPTNNQNKFNAISPPITIHIKVVPDCFAAPSVVNTVYAYNFAGDANESDNDASVTTNINFDTSNPAELGIWQGNFSDDWFDCRNWSKGLVPDGTINVNIPATATIQPVIDFDSPLRPVGAVAQSANITVGGSASLTMIDASELHVSGNWTNNGNFVPGNGTVAFVGSNNQQVIDILGTPTFSNLKINTTNSAKVFISNDQGLYVNNQLNLQSGVLRLEGMSQLLQPNSGTVIATTGKLWREQRGDANEYNYNYWSSPVGTTSTNYQIANVMKDGSDILNPQNIEWTGGDNGAPTTPITISNRWLYKFQSTSPLYANWQKIYQNDPIQAGLGYTMKGSGTNDPSETQNYIFVGVPFTGNITHTISNDQIALLGNPYTSALDANLFIQQNSGVIDGTLQFWDHFITTNSHYLDQYKGGYAKYNQTSQIVAVNVDNVSSTKVPQQFIPVGQGFFVSAEPGISNNSPIVFRNSQRAFVKEDEAGGMQMFGIPDGSNTSAGTFDGPTKIKLNMISAGDYKHQIAIGFMQDKATEEIDYGYDAKLRETDPNQFYFMHPDEKLVIQGVGYFDEENKYPLGVIADAAGRYTFTIDHIENLAENTAVYLYDNKKQIYHNLRKSDYFVNLASGEYNTRFSLRFKNFALENDLNTQQLLNNIVVYHQNNYVIITNPSEETTILKATMFNMLGQNVTSWNIENGRESHIELPLQSLAAGVYVVQVQTDQGSVSKKINIK